MFWIRENKGASIACHLQDWRSWLWILLILEIRNFYVVELDLKKPKNSNFISHKGLGRIYSTREKQHKNSTLSTWCQMQMAACLAQSWVLGLLFPGIHKYVMEREREIVQCTKCYKFRHQNCWSCHINIPPRIIVDPSWTLLPSRIPKHTLPLSCRTAEFPSCNDIVSIHFNKVCKLVLKIPYAHHQVTLWRYPKLCGDNQPFGPKLKG